MSYILCGKDNFLVHDHRGTSVTTDLHKASKWDDCTKANNVLNSVRGNKVLSKYNFQVKFFDDEEFTIHEDIELVDVPTEEPVKKVRRKIFSQEQRAEIYRKTKGHCYLCGDFVDFNKFEVEHRVPISKGGTNDLSNLFCSCHVCNSIKCDIYPEDFMERITKIFLYQMDRKHGKKMVWKMMSKKIGKMLGE